MMTNYKAKDYRVFEMFSEQWALVTAMNYAIYRYNNSSTGALYPCTVHYKINDTYNHRYPLLKSEKPTVESGWNVLNLLN